MRLVFDEWTCGFILCPQAGLAQHIGLCAASAVYKIARPSSDVSANLKVGQLAH